MSCRGPFLVKQGALWRKITIIDIGVGKKYVTYTHISKDQCALMAIECSPVSE